MVCKKNIPDLRNYKDKSPVSLTKEVNNATIKLFSKLNKGKLSAQRDGWVDGKEVRGILENFDLKLKLL